MIVLGLVKQIFIRKLLCMFIQSQYAAMKKISDRRTGVFANVFDVDFFIFSIN